MHTTSDSAVIQRLVLWSYGRDHGSSGDDATVSVGAVVDAAVRELGWPAEELPARTAVVLSGPGLLSAAARSGAAGAVIAESSASALRVAHQALRRGHADRAVVATLGEPTDGALTVLVLRRAADAAAVGERALAVVGTAAHDEDGRAGSVVRATADLLDPHGRLHQALRAELSDDAELYVRATDADDQVADPDGPRLLLWSGRDEEEETRVREELRTVVLDVPPGGFPMVATAWPENTRPGRVRAAVVTTADTAAEAVEVAVATTARNPRPIVLMFPGQGSQHVQMAAGLYGREPVFTAAVDSALCLMGGDGEQARADWLSDRPLIEIDDVRRAQPLLFAIDYALGCTVLNWGVRPAAVIGHSAGELVAATLAGVFTLPEAAFMVRERVRGAVRIPAGGMLAVAASEADLLPYLFGEVAIAAVNSARQTMIAGPAEPLREVADRLRADEFTVVTVPATTPFHCPAMAPVVEDNARAFAGIRFRAPARPLYSGYTGDVLNAEDARTPRFWARQLTDAVYFGPALDKLLAAGDALLVEAGPGQTLTAFARRHRAVRSGESAVVPLLPGRPGTAEADRKSVLTAAARLWTEGHDIDHGALEHLWWG